MKINLSFDPSKQPSEHDDAMRALQADEVYSVLWDISQEIRAYQKYGERTAEETIDLIESLIEDDIFKYYQ